jgi:single-stranded-DNA-specific exonuclease
VVIGSHDWNAGILGILASKVLDKYNVNVFCFGQDESDDKKFKGSCRSRGDIHLVKLMTKVKEKFLHFGGHELAGGFSISFDQMHDLENELNKNIDDARIENLVEQSKQDNKNNVIEINLENITPDFFEGLKLIGPFGVGNPKPIFKIKNILENKIERFGKSKEHLKIKLIGKNNSDRRIETEAIKFFVEQSEQENIISLYHSQELFFEIEAGWNSRNPRLKIIV